MNNETAEVVKSSDEIKSSDRMAAKLRQDLQVIEAELDTYIDKGIRGLLTRVSRLPEKTDVECASKLSLYVEVLTVLNLTNEKLNKLFRMIMNSRVCVPGG